MANAQIFLRYHRMFCNRFYPH